MHRGSDDLQRVLTPRFAGEEERIPSGMAQTRGAEAKYQPIAAIRVQPDLRNVQKRYWTLGATTPLATKSAIG